MALRLAFMGSPDFAAPILAALQGAGHAVVAVYTQKPRPAGRGHAMQRSAVHREAERLGLMVRTPDRLSGEEEAAAFAALDLDAAVVAAYGLLLPKAFLNAPRLGCLNVHASLLPRWRGAAPIQAAIMAGDAQTGVSIMRMDEGLDTGPVLLAEAVPIGPETTTAALHPVLSTLGARLMLRALAENPPARPQPRDGVTYARKLTRADGRMDWWLPAAYLARQLRALTPWPGCWTSLGGVTLKVHAAHVVAARDVPAEGAPGVTLDGVLTVACGEAALRLTRVQLPGRAAMDAAEFLRGHAVPAGTKLG